LNMAKSAAPVLLFGAAALLLLSKKKSNGSSSQLPAPDEYEFDHSEELPPVDAQESYEDLLLQWIDPQGRAYLGKFYQAREGDTPIGISREALFGTRQPRVEPWERQAAIELSIRIDCGPWNQTLYGKDASQLSPGHHAVDNGWSQVGVSLSPSFQDNASRLAQGIAPTAAPGGGYPLIWIPMIDLDALDSQRIVTTFGQDWPDDGDGGYNMINPPPWVVDLGFDQIAQDQVGCALPEGDFRKSLEQS
jgi:hypothetical protein